MNKRIMKKKYNKWASHSDDQTIELGPMVSCAAEYKGIQQTRPHINRYGQIECFFYTPEFIKFANSRNVRRAVNMYADKYVYHTGRCDNIKEMYRVMCDSIHEDREYRKRIIEQITAEEVHETSEEWDHLESVRAAFGM